MDVPGLRIHPRRRVAGGLRCIALLRSAEFPGIPPLLGRFGPVGDGSLGWTLPRLPGIRRAGRGWHVGKLGQLFRRIPHPVRRTEDSGDPAVDGVGVPVSRLRYRVGDKRRDSGIRGRGSDCDRTRNCGPSRTYRGRGAGHEKREERTGAGRRFQRQRDAGRRGSAAGGDRGCFRQRRVLRRRQDGVGMAVAQPEPAGRRNRNDGAPGNPFRDVRVHRIHPGRLRSGRFGEGREDRTADYPVRTRTRQDNEEPGLQGLR